MIYIKPCPSSTVPLKEELFFLDLLGLASDPLSLILGYYFEYSQQMKFAGIIPWYTLPTNCNCRLCPDGECYTLADTPTEALSMQSMHSFNSINNRRILQCCSWCFVDCIMKWLHCSSACSMCASFYKGFSALVSPQSPSTNN